MRIQRAIPALFPEAHTKLVASKSAEGSLATGHGNALAMEPFPCLLWAACGISRLHPCQHGRSCAHRWRASAPFLGCCSTTLLLWSLLAEGAQGSHAPPGPHPLAPGPGRNY